MKILSIKETCIYVKDLEHTKDFYSEKLGLTLISFVQNRHVFFRAGSSVLLCFVAEETQKQMELPPHGAQGSIHFAFEVHREYYNEAMEQIINAGILILHKQFWKGNLQSFYFHDPDNNVVEVIEQGLWDQ